MVQGQEGHCMGFNGIMLPRLPGLRPNLNNPLKPRPPQYPRTTITRTDNVGKLLFPLNNILTTTRSQRLERSNGQVEKYPFSLNLLAKHVR